MSDVRAIYNYLTLYN